MAALLGTETFSWFTGHPSRSVPKFRMWPQPPQNRRGSFQPPVGTVGEYSHCRRPPRLARRADVPRAAVTLRQMIKAPSKAITGCRVYK